MTRPMTRSKTRSMTHSTIRLRRAPLHAALAASLLAATLLAGCGKSVNTDKLLASANDYAAKQDHPAAVIQLKSLLQEAPGNAQARLLLGRSLLETGDAAGAAIELRKALEGGVSPDTVQPLLARAVLAQGDPRAVVQQFSNVTLADAEASADLRTTLGVAFAAQGERDKALAIVLEALKEWPQHTPATLLHARIKAADGDLAGAMTLVDGVLEREPTHLATLLFKGELQRYGQRDLKAALETYGRAVQAHPRSAASHAAMVQMLLEQRENDAAKARFAQLKTVLPDHPETRLFEAQFAFLDGDLPRARELSTQLLRFLPDDPRLLQLAGVTELRLGALPQAEAHLGRVVQARPADPVPRQLLAQIYVRTGQPARALTALQPMLDAAAPDSTSLTLAGEALLQTGDTARAEKLFAQAAKTNPQAATARTALALGQVARGNAAAGFSELEAVSATDPGIRSNLALIAARLRSNDVPGALKAIDALEQKQPDRPLAHVLRGSVLQQRNDPAGAIAAFEKAISIDPLFYPATAGLAALELAAGRPEGAQKRFDALLARDPRNHRALLGVAELKVRTGAPREDITKTLNSAIGAAPGELAPRAALVTHLLGGKETAAALTAAQAAAAALPTNPDVLGLLGAAQLAAGESRQAVATFVQLASRRPDRPEPELRLAEAHIAAQDLPAARRSLNKALSIRADFLPAQVGLVQLGVREEKFDDALAMARTVQKAQPKQAVGFMLEAETEFARKRVDAGLAALRAAQQAAPSSETAIRLHSALIAAGRAPDAERAAAGWLRERPKDGAFRFYLGDAALARNDLVAAEQHYRSVLEVRPDNALALNNVAWLLTQRKSPDALAMAQRANELLPNQSPLLDTLASALLLAGQGAKALEVQKQAITRSPQDPGLKLNLAKIHISNGEKAQARTELEALAGLGDAYRNQAEVKSLLATL